MRELALMAAERWANANTRAGVDPIEFGAKVASVYLAVQNTVHHAGNEKATAAALAALSVPAEVWQSLALLSSLARPTPAPMAEAGSDGSGARL